MNIYNLKQIVFLKSSLPTCRKQLWQLQRKLSVKNIQEFPGNEYKSVSKYENFVPANYLLEKLTSVSLTPQKKFAKIRKRFVHPTAKKSTFFLEIYSSKGPLETHSWVLTNLMKNFCQTLGSIVRSSKLVLKGAFFEKKFLFIKDPLER